MADHTHTAHWFNKFGWNPDVDSGQVQDIWDYGGDARQETYPWPAAAATTTVVSDSANDTAEGTGARTVQVEGLDANYGKVVQTATLNGTTPVTLSTDLLRVYDAKVLTAGTNETNVGNVDVKHGGILARITAGYGRTMMAIYTVPAGQTLCVSRVYGSGNFPNQGVAHYDFDIRPFGGAWTTELVIILGGRTGAVFNHVWAAWERIPEKTDMRIRIRNGTNNSSVVTAGFDAYRVVPGL